MYCFLERATPLAVIVILLLADQVWTKPLIFSPGDGDSSLYSLSKSNRGPNFYSDGFWQFWTSADPTHGNVQFLAESDAIEQGLIGMTETGAAFARTSNKDIPPNTNRPSIRFQSSQSYDQALIIFDVAKMPIGAATWPALWTCGPQWPKFGEIDVMENIGVTGQGTFANLVSVHMGNNSPNQASPSSFSGRAVGTNCDTNYGKGENGCQIYDSNENGPSWGTAFNNNGGGVWALQYGQDGGVKVWFWGRGQVPNELSNPRIAPGILSTLNWGQPMANFQSEVINSNLRQQQIILDITIGGDWAGSEPLDGPYTGESLTEALQKGSNYNNAEFIINGIDIYV